MAEPNIVLPKEETAALFAEAAQRVRECRCPADIAEALPAMGRACRAMRPYFREEVCPITFGTIPLQAEKLASVVAIEIADPDGSTRLPFYLAVEERSGKCTAIAGKDSRDNLAVLLDRWSRFFATKARQGKDRTDAGTSAPDGQTGKQPTLETHMQQLAQAVGDDNSARIVATAHRADLTGEQKMEEILRLDSRFVGKNSKQWSQLLRVSPAAVRNYTLWKQIQRRKKAD